MLELGFVAPSGDTEPSASDPSGNEALPVRDQEPLVDGSRAQLGISPKTILRIYSEAFSGKEARIIKELTQMSKQCLEPLEVETLGEARSFDISDDSTFDMIIRMAWTGIIHVH